MAFNALLATEPGSKISTNVVGLNYKYLMAGDVIALVTVFSKLNLFALRTSGHGSTL
ncbi:hypothetical protein [Paraburkholderia sp. BL10I2N1]|uniref:hypothetical protein n=1 Tax=Paraburkholderia sp. BL10I2N1 TaxID=1938796 RepID=UPI0010E51B1D|nr:hypothetical protein [Paraburkholderia sp. BL10I2N1]TDN69939.1 hypothetical protein B0G77_3366 [Paraburkholderia sp. BL10I2N1]